MTQSIENIAKENSIFRVFSNVDGVMDALHFTCQSEEAAIDLAIAYYEDMWSERCVNVLYVECKS
jgi:hypothetical protein